MSARTQWLTHRRKIQADIYQAEKCTATHTHTHTGTRDDVGNAMHRALRVIHGYYDILTRSIQF